MEEQSEYRTWTYKVNVGHGHIW